MINVETMKLISIMNSLAELSANGISSFEEASEDSYVGGRLNQVFYDKDAIDDKGHYRVVCDSVVDSIHHNVVSYWDDLGTGFTIVAIAEDDEVWLEVRIDENDTVFVIENGHWYCACYM